jgi:GntR family transcriptional regulator
MNPDFDLASASLALKNNQPRYLQLAQTLLNEIKGGTYPVGSQLPTEFALCEQFGVSRSTAREAVKRLVQMGLVIRQPRIGSTVQAVQPATGYRQNTADVGDLYRYATDTTLVIEARRTQPLTEALAQELEAKAGETWLCLQGKRHTNLSAPALCLTEIWLHPTFRSIQGMSGALTGAVHAAIEQQFGETITSVEQEIRAITLSKTEAAALEVAPKAPALWIRRQYRNRYGQLVEQATSIHPADRFSYSTTLRREWGIQGQDS